MIRALRHTFARTAVSLMASIMASAAVAAPMAHSAIPAGYYVGPGDGIKVVLRVFPNGTAILGSILHAVTPQSVQKNATIQAGGSLGTLKPHGTQVVLSIPAQPKYALPACQRTLSPAKGGWMLTHETKGCVSYHGAAWGYGTGEGGVLKKYAG